MYIQIIIKKFLLFFFTVYMRISGKNINFNDNEIRKSYFYKNKKLYNIEEIDANKILVSKKESYNTNNLFIYFIRYNDNDASRPLCVKLLQMTGYARKFDENVTLSFKINKKQLLKIIIRYGKKIEES